MTKKKKIVILSCMIALLAVTAVCNFLLTSSTANSDSATVVANANYLFCLLKVQFQNLFVLLFLLTLNLMIDPNIQLTSFLSL